MAGVTFKKITCTEVTNKEDYYDVKLQTYNSVLEGRFERSQIRHMIEVLDNAINVGTLERYVPIKEMKEPEKQEDEKEKFSEQVGS